MNRIFETVEKNIDNLAEREVLWSRCVSDEEMRSAKEGEIDLHLTHTKKLPADWLSSSGQGEWIEFGHTMEEYLGGLTDAGFVISGYREEQSEDITDLFFFVKAGLERKTV